MDKNTHPYFVPNDTQGSRRETAVLLVGTADEYDIPQREIASTRDGFRISEKVAIALGYVDEDGEDTSDGEIDGGQSDARSAQGVTVGQDSDAADGDEVESYADWERNDLLAEVARRNLVTEDKKTATLVAALENDDEAVAALDDANADQPTDPDAL